MRIIRTQNSELRTQNSVHLGRCAEQLRGAVHHLANSSGTPQEKLLSMYANTQFESIARSDFPNESLRHDFQAISGQLSDGSKPHLKIYIKAMSDERARKVIEQICALSEAVAYSLGRQSNST